MADRLDYYYRQKVTEAELDLAFSLLEKADRNLISDLKFKGIISGALPVPHAPVANLTVDLTGPATAYDQLGQRVAYGTGQTVDCSVDLVGVPTEVTQTGNERWLGLFLRFKRQLSDPRTDGNSVQVYFRRDESFELIVRQAPEGAIGAAPKVELQAEELLICEIRRRFGQTQIIKNDIDSSRRQAFVFATSDTIPVSANGWSMVQPAKPNVQSTFDDIDYLLDGHFFGSNFRHSADAINFVPYGFITSSQVQSAFHDVVEKLTSSATNDSGSSLIGVDGIAGTPLSIPAGTLRAVLATLLERVNGQSTAYDTDHFGAGFSNAGKHRAIHQPQLGTGRVLVLDSAASGYNYTRFRIFVDSSGLDNSVWFTLNANWNGSAWAADTLGVNAAAFRLAPTEMALHWRAGIDIVGPFTTWSASWRLSFGGNNNTAFEVSGNRIQEVGRLGLRYQNTGSTAQTVQFGNNVNFRARFATAPTSVSFTPVAASNATTASLGTISNEGFSYTISTTNLAAGGAASWDGTYTVVGS